MFTLYLSRLSSLVVLLSLLS